MECVRYAKRFPLPILLFLFSWAFSHYFLLLPSFRIDRFAFGLPIFAFSLLFRVTFFFSLLSIFLFFLVDLRFPPRSSICSCFLYALQERYAASWSRFQWSLLLICHAYDRFRDSLTLLLSYRFTYYVFVCAYALVVIPRPCIHFLLASCVSISMLDIGHGMTAFYRSVSLERSFADIVGTSGPLLYYCLEQCNLGRL